MRLQKGKLEKLKRELQSLEEEESKRIEIPNDPIEFAKKILNFNPLPYQERLLRDPSKRIAVRMSRQCVDENTLIFLNNGTVEYIKNLPYAWYTGIKPVYRVETVSGKVLYCTLDHKFLTKNGWKPLSELKIGDEIFVQNEIPIFGNYEISDERVKILAYLVSDGSIRSKGQSIKFTGRQPYVDEFIISIKKEFPDIEPKVYKKGRCFDVLCTAPKRGRAIRDIGKSGKPTIMGMKPNSLKAWLSSLDFIGEIPRITFQFSKEKLALFLNRLFAADGWISVYNDPRGYAFSAGKRIEIGYGSLYPETIQALQMLLLKFGVHGSVTTEEPKAQSKKKKPMKRPFYKLRIWREDLIEKFLAIIGPIFGKEERWKEAFEIITFHKNQNDQRGHRSFI